MTARTDTALHDAGWGVPLRGDRVLPSHGLPFTGLHTCIDRLQRHHEARLAATGQQLPLADGRGTLRCRAA